MRTAAEPATYRYEYEVTPGGELRWISSSEGLLRMLGFDRQEVGGTSTWKRAVDVADQEAANAIVARFAAGKSWSGRFRVRAKDGRNLVLDLHNEVEKASDGRLLVHGTARDVTDEAELEQELNERETRLRLLMQKILVVLWSTDRDLRFTSISGSGLPALGLEENEVVGMSLYEFFGVDDPSFMPIGAHLRALEGETVDYDIEWAGRKYRASVEPLRNEMGIVHSVVGVAIDATDENALEGEAREAGRKVVQLRAAAGDDRATDGEAAQKLEAGPLEIDLRAHRVTKEGRSVRLTPTEFRLLVELAARPGELRPRGELLQSVWGHTFAGEPSLWMTIRRLREKIEDDPRHPKWIETVRGLGYRFTDDSTTR